MPFVGDIGRSIALPNRACGSEMAEVRAMLERSGLVADSWEDLYEGDTRR